MTQTRAGSLQTPDGAHISYLTLGAGPRRLVYLPGAGDGLATAAQAARRINHWLKWRGDFFEVLYLSRRDPLPQGFTLEDQAQDVIWAMEQLGWAPAVIEAQSAGGPLGQLVAARRPDLAPLLVLSSSAAFLDDHAKAQLSRWIDEVRRGDWESFFEGTAKLLWQSGRFASLRPFQRLLMGMATPKEPTRLINILESIKDVDHRQLIQKLSSPVLISAGAQDQLFRESLQREMSLLIPQSTLWLGEGFGHGHDMENPEHVQRVAAFARLHKGKLLPQMAAG